MSTQRGNVKKSGPPKHKNKTAFKNSLHDTSKRTQQINSMQVTGACARCKDVIEWKIKYKKYKPLSQPKKCTKCQQKTVKKAYYIICQECAKKDDVCAKCGKNEEIVTQPELPPSEQASMDSQFQQELEMLPERKRRTFLRLQAQGKLSGEVAAPGDVMTEEDEEDYEEDEIDNSSEEDDT